MVAMATTAEHPEDEQTLSAYDLLSTPTLDLSDKQVEAIVVDLQKRRKLYIQTGKVDKAPKPKAEPKAKATAEDKARNTALLLGQLKLQ